ncbi:MAG: hypothetical protein K2M19_02575 [Muribaculaceae bacterium]|nr:hypothetical protein [Muribaculaceae bacterium]
MKRLKLFLLACVAAGAVNVSAAAPTDSLQVRVGVEIMMPDGTRVTRHVNTTIADPGPDASVATLIDLAARKLSPKSQNTVVREVNVIAPAPVVVVENPTETVENVAVPTQVAEKHECVVAETVKAQDVEIDSLTGEKIIPLIPASEVVMTDAPGKKTTTHRHHDWKPDPVYAVSRVRFAWGAELASSVDLSGHDMTSVDLNLSFGLTYRWLIFAGIGAGADMMVSNSCRTYPVYLSFRTDFSRRVLPIFLDLRVGSAFNCLPENINQQAPYASISLGFNLATGRTFRSYILCGYTYNGRRDVDSDMGLMRFPSLSLASVRLGVQF